MPEKPSYEELEQRVKELEKESIELKKVKEALRESERRFHHLVEHATDAFLLHDLDGRIIDVNQHACESLGYTREELLALSIHDIDLDFFPGKHLERWEQLVPGEPIAFEGVHRRKDGTTFPVEVRLGAFEPDKRRLMLGLVRDISERKRAEEALKESEQKYKTLTENSLTGVFIHKDGKYVFVNDRFAEIHGYKPEEMLGKEYLTFIHPDQRGIVKQRASQRLKGEAAPQRYEIQRLRKDGETIWCETMVTRIQYRGRPAIMGNLIDIQEIKRSHEALRESEERFRHLSEAAFEGIAIHEEGILLKANEQFFEIFGYEPQELLGKQAIPISIAPESIELVKKQISSGATTPYEVMGVKKDGTKFPTEVYAKPFEYQGRMVRVAAIRDITELKRVEEEKLKLEAQLFQAQKVEAIGTLAGGIAHNFNNLLMGIMGSTSLMLLEIDSNHPNYEKLINIEKQVQRGSKLTGQLLGYAREGRYEIRPISLNQLMEETSDTFATTRKEIRVHREPAEDLPGINADQGQIEQVLLNLYVNASDAMPGGGDLFLKTMNVTHKDMRGKPYTGKPGSYILLTVRDTGIGMDKRTMERIFEPFFTTKEMGRGTGLGLASVYGIIKAHAGYIDVSSKKGHGTTFEIYLPASEKKVIKEKEVPVEALKGTETVLLVDDEDIVIEVGEQMLSKLGYNVLLARGGREALELYKKNQDKINMVLLDMIMPDMGGGETYDRIKETNPYIRVLLSSGYGIDGQATEILERGCNGFIQKPFNMEQLSQRIREVLYKK